MISYVPPRRGWRRGAVRRRFLLVVVAILVTLVAGVSISRPLVRPPDKVQVGRLQTDDRIVTTAAQQSLSRYWKHELPAVYHRPFQSLAGGFQPKRPGSPPFFCGGGPRSYRDLQGNAFYCSRGEDYIAWDAADLFPELSEQFGSIAEAVVLAHEMGHAVQARASVGGPSVIRELQADCFAGSWTRFAQVSSEDPIELTEGALDSAVAAMLTLRDKPGTTPPHAHGNGFDRVNAFQSGYEQGAGSCAALADKAVVPTELPFRTVSEALSERRLPLDETIGVVSARLDAFWAETLPTISAGTTFAPPARQAVGADRLPECAGWPQAAGISAYCPTTRSVSWLAPALSRIHERIGDLGTGTVLSEAWAEAAQSQAGLPVTGTQAGLQRDCLTGAWIGFLAHGDLAHSPLSPGDLDEVLLTIVSSRFTTTGEWFDEGGWFARTEALRSGLFEGSAACMRVHSTVSWSGVVTLSSS